MPRDDHSTSKGDPESPPEDDTPSTTVLVPESVRDEILAHAREGAPEEVCGVLAGARGSSDESSERAADHRVETCHRAENAAETPRTRYEIDPREQLALLEDVEESGREVVGFYHSHPRGPDAPSATDAAEATWPGRSYVIVSLAGDGESASLGSWRWTGAEFVVEQVRVVELRE